MLWLLVNGGQSCWVSYCDNAVGTGAVWIVPPEDAAVCEDGNSGQDSGQDSDKKDSDKKDSDK